MLPVTVAVSTTILTAGISQAFPRNCSCGGMVQQDERRDSKGHLKRFTRVNLTKQSVLHSGSRGANQLEARHTFTTAAKDDHYGDRLANSGRKYQRTGTAVITPHVVPTTSNISHGR
jgi:hypothetical protein